MASSFEGFYNKALKFLSYRPRSEKEVRDNLKGKSQKSKVKISDDLVELIIKKLKEQKFLNDSEFTRWWIEQRTLVKPMGVRLIKIELKQKGVEREIIEEVMNQESGIMNQEEMARNLVQRKFDKFKNMSREKIYQRLGGFLSRRGFDYDTIKKAIDEALKEDYNSF